MMFLFLQNFAQRLSDFVNAYFFLQDWHLASLKHCYYIFKHPKPMAFASMLHCLSAAGLLTDESIELIFNYDHRKYEQLISCIRIIKDESFRSKICILGG